MNWPHSWVAYFAGCRCDQCLNFDRRCFERGECPSEVVASDIRKASDGPTIVATEGV